MQAFTAEIYRLTLHVSHLLASQKKIWLLLLVSIIFSNGITKLQAQQPLIDYQVKAAMLYKFLGYSSWPENRFADADSPYRIYVVGAEDIKTELEDIVAQRLVNNRAVEIYSASSVNEIIDAHVVFVSGSKEKLLSSLSRVARKKALLIVTENEEGLIPGSAINLRLVNERIGFDISLAVAQDCGISFSSRLLSIAITVKGAQN